MADLSVEIGGLRLQNPVMPGSGTFAEGLSEVIDLDGLGALVAKTITPEIREGVPPPRVVEYPDATLFAIGIPSKGPDHFLEHTLPFYRRFRPPFVASISAGTSDDFGRLAAKLSVEGVAAIEANLSCPNLKADGLCFGMDERAIAEVVAAMKKSSPLPIWAKLTPNVGDIAACARAAERAGAAAVIVANALLGMAIDPESMRPRLGNVTGGLTGPAVRPVIVRMVHQCARAVSIPVIGSGGASTAADVLEYMLAGATAVQIGTASFVHPTAMPRAIAGLDDYCSRKGIARLRDLIGAVRLEPEIPEGGRAYA